MQKESRLILKSVDKEELRKQYLSLRASIPNHRREEAAKALAAAFSHRGRILSFYSVASEIDTSLLNGRLLEQKNLFYPRVEKNFLTAYQQEQNCALIVSSFGICEPDPSTARKISLSEIDLILVPALAFDQERYRLGYGKGHYDRFLSTTGNIPTIGVGFREQLSMKPLPRDPWDVPVTELFLL